MIFDTIFEMLALMFCWWFSLLHVKHLESICFLVVMFGSSD